MMSSGQGHDGGGHHERARRGPGPAEQDQSVAADIAEGPDPEGRRAASRYATGLAALVVLAGLAAAVGAVVLVVHQLTEPGGTVQVTVSDPAAFAVDPPEGMPPGTSLELVGSGDTVALHVDVLPPVLRALTRGPILVAGMIALLGAILLRRVLSEIAHARPFAPVVARRLAALAVVLLAGALLPQAVDSLTTVAVLEHLGHRGPDSPIGFMIFQLDLIPVLLAGIVGVVAQVFRHGQRLTDEVEGLI